METKIKRKFQPVHLVFTNQKELEDFVNFLHPIPTIHSGIADEIWNELNAYLKELHEHSV